jgi:hypothetical protein
MLGKDSLNNEVPSINIFNTNAILDNFLSERISNQFTFWAPKKNLIECHMPCLFFTKVALPKN